VYKKDFQDTHLYCIQKESQLLDMPTLVHGRHNLAPQFEPFTGSEVLKGYQT
jgi:hypothetical protein